MLGVVGLAAPSMAHVPVATTSQLLGGNHKNDEITTADKIKRLLPAPETKVPCSFLNAARTGKI